MQRDFSGKVVVVTGAAAGIGLAMAETFAQNGAKLALVDRDSRVGEVAKTIAGSRAYVLDLSDASAVEQTFAKIGADFGTIHVLINNAGIGLMGPAESLPVADWVKTMSVNLRGQYLCARAAAPFMLRQKWGQPGGQDGDNHDNSQQEPAHDYGRVPSREGEKRMGWPPR